MKRFTLLLLFFCSASSVSANVLTSYFQEGSAPKYYIENNQLKGLCVAYINQINQILSDSDTQIEITTGANFSRIKTDLQNGAIDIFFGITKTSDREEIYEYGEPLYGIRYSFAVPSKNAEDYTTHFDLAGMRVGIVEGTKSAKYIKKHYANFEPVPVDSIKQALKMLVQQRLDAVFYHDMGLSYQKQQIPFGDQIKVSYSSAPSRVQYFAFNKDLPMEVKSEITSAFKNLVESGKQENMLKHFGVSSP